MKLKAVLVACAMIITTGSALANCYELIGCDDSQHFARRDLRQLSCQSLWEVRNMVYQQNGYCFSTARAQRAFGNEGCTITRQREVRLNAFERENVARIAAAETAKGCN